MTCKVSGESRNILLLELVVLAGFLTAGLWKGYLVLWIGTGISVVSIIDTLYFFRDPDRLIPQNENSILSPADGKIVRIEIVNGLPFLHGPVTMVAIFLSLWNVHINRIPVSGHVKLLQYIPGSYYPAFMQSASKRNAQMLIGIKSSIGTVFMKQIAGTVARRIVCRLKTGQQVQRGERFGMIKFGSRVELFLPADVQLCVSEGDRVRGGESTIGEVTPNE